MDNAPSNNEASIGTSALEDGLWVALPPGFTFSFHVSNDELASAIAYAFERCDKSYIGGDATSTTEAGKAMLEHLKKLLDIQSARAGFIETPNATGSAARRCTAT